MATQTVLEKLTGTVDAMQQPVYVYDDTDPPVSITESAAVTAAQSAAPASLFSINQDANPAVEQLADFAWRITISYRARSLRKLTNQALGEVRYNMNLVAQPLKDVRFATEVNKFPASAPSMNGLLTMSRSGNSVQPMGVTIQPPPPNVQASTVVTRATISSSYLSTLPSLIGKYNNAVIGTHQIGEVYLSRVVTRLLDDDNVLIDVGWSIQPNVTGATRGSITSISYRGHDYVWDMYKPVTDRNGNTLALEPQYTYVNDVWGGANIAAVGLDPP